MRITSRLQPLSHKRQRVSSPSSSSDSNTEPILQRPYQHLSDLRTTNSIVEPVPKKQRRVFSLGTMQDPCCVVETPPSLPNCSECVQECEEGACDIELTEQCTEQCVVVPCNDAHHEFTPCEPADFSPDLLCDDEPDCSALENFLQSCSDYPQFFSDAKAFQDVNVPATSNWSNHGFTDAMFQGFQSQPQSQTNGPFYLLDSSTSTPQLVGSPATFVATPNSAPSPGPQLPQSQQLLLQNDQSAAARPQGHSCMWGNCNATFATMNELVGHVNLQHLRLPSTGGASDNSLTSARNAGQNQNLVAGNIATSSSHQNPLITDSSALACLWADCRIYPTPNSIPGPSIGSEANNVLGVLASHLLQDHLGLPSRPSSPPSLAQLNIQIMPQKQAGDGATPTPTKLKTDLPEQFITTPSPPISCPPTPAPEHDCSAPHAHVCRWTGCGESFTSCDTLTTHINTSHVGSGKAHYDCYWEGCGRNGESGFASKQKICRHLQSHTGHRPFQCKICQQNFSEAATLAQHMRRHTQEKPYICDFPGCGKSFAITGALTIHKRTHNGHKPFKCTFCDKAFTESSNLSKHLRTHTGVRPYPCAEPGCNKTFARPDQLARHITVHRKRDGAGGKDINITKTEGGTLVAA